MSKVRHLIPPNLTRMLYLSMVEPYLNYCNFIWASANTSVLLNKVLIVQKRFIRLMTFSDYLAHSKPLFFRLYILPIYELYKYNLAVYMFRIINNLILPLTHHQFIFNSSIHHHNTRSKSKIHTRYCRTAMRQNTFAFQGPRLWREMPSYLITATSLPTFKKIAKSFFVNKICSI